jgi:hypothetical protein
MSINTVYKPERGQGNPILEALNKLAEVLGMTALQRFYLIRSCLLIGERFHR